MTCMTENNTNNNVKKKAHGPLRNGINCYSFIHTRIYMFDSDPDRGLIAQRGPMLSQHHTIYANSARRAAYFMCIIYPTDFLRTFFIRVTNSYQKILMLVFPFADFCTDK